MQVKSLKSIAEVDVFKITTRKQSLIKALERRIIAIKNADILKSESKTPNNPGNTTGKQIEMITHRINRLNSIDELLASSLQIFQEIVNSRNIDNLDKNIKHESSFMIEEFQKIVLKAKNDDLESIENDKDLISEQDALKNETVTENVINDVLKEVSKQADVLEDSIKQDTFKDRQKEKDTTIETVIKVNGDDVTSNSTDDKLDHGKNPVLIDSHNNQWVLSKPGDATAHVEDLILMQDILIMLISCFIAAVAMYLFRLPIFFGYIVAGIILTQNKFIQNAVQIETISRGLGVMFIMFFLGLEFNLGKIKRVWSISILGSFLILGLILVASTSVLPKILHATFQESLVIGSSVFLSSTAVVLHFMKKGEAESDYGRNIMGVLVAQDVLLGFLIALMPVLQASDSAMILYTVSRLVVLLVCFLVISYLVKFPIISGLKYLKSRLASPEIFLLSVIGSLLLFVQLGSLFEQSIELSCFVCGVVIAGQHTLAEQVVESVEPIKRMFGALFFASIGLHIYPSFLYNEWKLLISLAVFLMFFKILLSFIVINVVFRKRARNALVIAVALGQISEFTFVLASKAKR